MVNPTAPSMEQIDLQPHPVEKIHLRLGKVHLQLEEIHLQLG